MRHLMRRRLVGVIALTAMIVFAFQSLGTTPVAATSPGMNGRIFFERLTETSHGIYSIDADGTGIQRIVARAGQPAWSPNGRTLAFVRDGTETAIWLMNADGSGLRKLTNPTRHKLDGDPTWSPHGTRIAFSRGSGDGLVNDIRIVNADGTGGRKLTTDGNSLEPAWAPSGRRIAFTRTGTGFTYPLRVWVMKANGAAPHQVSPNRVSAYGASWSPDGRSIAFGTWRDQGPQHEIVADIWVMRSNGTALRRLTSGRHEDASPSWSPDGRVIAFTSDRSGSIKIWTIGAGGRHLRQVTWLDPSTDVSPSWRTIPR